MSTNQILDKVAALNAQNEQAKQETKKRRGVWAEVETFVDKASGIGVVITERIKGRPSYSVQILHFDDHGGNKFIALPCEGATRPVKEIVYLLVEQAEKFIEQKRAEDSKNRPRRDRDKNKDRKGKGPRKDRPVTTGLSELARRDAEKKGKADEFVGKTAKKKSRNKK